jgi:uncharacterized protein YkwD
MPTTLPRAALFLAGVWLALVLLVPLVARSDTVDPRLASLEAELHDRVNAVRAERHLVELRRDPAIDRVARAQAADMAARGYLSHDNPEGLSPVDRLSQGGVDGFTLAAENAGKTNRSDPNREILDGWIASPEHRRNLFFPPFNTTGLGVARAADGTYVYVQLYLTFPRD